MNYPYDPRAAAAAAAAQAASSAAAGGPVVPPLAPMHPAWINPAAMQNHYINQPPMPPYPGQMYVPPPPAGMYPSQAGAALYSWPPQAPPPIMHPHHPINPNAWAANQLHPALPLIPPILPPAPGTSAEPSTQSSATIKAPFQESFYTAPLSIHGIATTMTTSAKQVDVAEATIANGISASAALSLAARRKSHDSGSTGAKRKAPSSSDSSRAEDAAAVNHKDNDEHVTVKEEDGGAAKKRKAETASSSGPKHKALEADAADAAALKRLLSKQDQHAEEADEMFDDSLSSDSDGAAAPTTRLRGGAASGGAEVDNTSPAVASQDSNTTSANSPLSAVKPATQSAAALAAQNRQRGAVVAANGGIVHLGTGIPLLPLEPTPDSALARYQQHMNNFGNNPYYNDKIIAPSHRNARRIGADRRRRAKLKEALNLLRDIIMKHGQDATNFDQVSVLYASVDLMHTFENMIQQQQSCILQAEKVKKDLQHKVEALNKQVAASSSSSSSQPAAAATPANASSSSSSSSTAPATPAAAAATKEASRSDAATAN